MRGSARQGISATDSSGLRGACLQAAGSGTLGNSQRKIVRGIVWKNERASHVPLHRCVHAA